MRITSKGRFAVAAMIDVANYQNFGPVPLHDVAVRQNISVSYLESTFSSLRKSGLVQSTRGPGGGYSLAKSADLITIAEIVNSLNEYLYVTKDNANFETQTKCMEVDVWDQLEIKAMEFLQSVQLAALLNKDVSFKSTTKTKLSVVHGIRNLPARLMAAKNVPNSVFALGQIVPT